MLKSSFLVLLFVFTSQLSAKPLFICDTFADYDRFELDFAVGAQSPSGLTLTNIVTDKDLASLTETEKALIFSVISTQNLDRIFTLEEAIRGFFGLQTEDEWLLTSEAGDILYYQVPGLDDDQFFVTVAYYPGDNEYGAIYAIDGGRPRLIGQINDSDLYCPNLIDQTR
ncbi:MAG: hypothetical protein HRU19_22025 [Pseudobacteriovorax sp.]|nr:hypothetical protein [Pseudobacteriovorax sp.]